MSFFSDLVPEVIDLARRDAEKPQNGGTQNSYYDTNSYFNHQAFMPPGNHFFLQVRNQNGNFTANARIQSGVDVLKSREVPESCISCVAANFVTETGRQWLDTFQDKVNDSRDFAPPRNKPVRLKN